MNKIAATLLLVTIASGFESCRVWRSVFHRKEKKEAATAHISAITPPVKAPAQSGYSGADTAKTSTQLAKFMPLWEKGLSWNTFSGKARVHYEGKGDAQDFTATIRMERGEKVWVSIVALGLVEAVRACVTPDSIIMLDRIHHTYRAVATNESAKILPAGIDFGALQSLITGEVIHRVQSPGSVEMLSDGGVQFTLNTSGGLYQNAVFNAADKTMRSQSFVHAGTGSSADMHYDAYGNFGGRIFPAHRVLLLRDRGTDYNVDMDFKSAEFDVPVEMPFSIPARYDKK